MIRADNEDFIIVPASQPDATSFGASAGLRASAGGEAASTLAHSAAPSLHMAHTVLPLGGTAPGLLLSHGGHTRMGLSSALRGAVLEFPRPNAARIGPVTDVLTRAAEEILLAAESKIPGGVAHARLVAEAAASTALELGYREEHGRMLSCAGLLHDIGCAEWPAQLLTKPGRWSSEDLAYAQRHPVAGEIMIAQVRRLKPIIPWVRQHHERLDGRGYPYNLDVSQLSEEGRVLAIIEVFAACVAGRPFRGPLSPAETVERLKRSAFRLTKAIAPGDTDNSKSHTALDPAITEAFLAALQKAVPEQTWQHPHIWPEGGLAFDSPTMRRALRKTFRAVSERLLEGFETYGGYDAAQKLRRELNREWASHKVPISATHHHVHIHAPTDMPAIEVAALSRRAMLLQAQCLEQAMSQAHATRLRDTTHASLTPWGRELAERYEMFDSLALSNAAPQTIPTDGFAGYTRAAAKTG